MGVKMGKREREKGRRESLRMFVFAIRVRLSRILLITLIRGLTARGKTICPRTKV